MRSMPLSQLSRRDAFRSGLAGIAALGFGAACADTKTSVETNGPVLPAEATDPKTPVAANRPVLPTEATDPKTPVAANGPVLPAEAIASEAYGLSLASFTPLLGSVFRFAQPSGDTVDLRLTEATDLGVHERPIWDKGECFSLSFAAEGASASGGLAQDTYAISHSALRSFSIFIVPGATAGARSYTAIFNRV
ncbi:MAG TPA: hypothetical protein VER96_31695 [Polyangiaceae bacterium]|nr:hypothetical protein [Polyangiaceae bacterium]